jgi:putative ABC transport system permease protein
MISELRYAFRQLVKSPGYACATILILALGIGGVTAMFSTLYAVMIRPLPYVAPERLVMGRETQDGHVNPWLSGPKYLDYRDQSRSFTALEAFLGFTFEVSVSEGQNTERANGLRVSPGLFRTLGVNISQGRSFTAEDAKAEAAPVAMVSHAYWRRRFGSENNLANRTLLIGGVAFTVIGVTPPEFHFIREADIWLPQRPQDLGPRRFNNWLLVGRLKDGVSLAQAQSDVDVISARLEKAYPEIGTNRSLLLTPLQGAFTEQYQSGIRLLCGGAAAVLLIACANAAGLLLARGAGRQGELAVRAALGASTWQIMRLLLAEALLLAAAAGVAGAVLALWMQSGLLRLFSVEALFLRDVGLSWPVLLFVFSVTLFTGFGFGLLPAWRVRRPDLALDVKANSRGTSHGGSRLRGGLVAAQVAISFVLLVVAGLLIRSLVSLHQTDPGFDPRNLLTVEVPLSARDYKDQQRTAFFESLLENVRALPGVRSAAAISQLPLRNPFNDVSIYELGASPTISGNQRVVLPGYFQTMGIPLVAGRDVQASDTRDSSRVVVISQVLVERLFSGRDPLGRKVVIDGATDTPWEVVGVVGDVKASSLQEERPYRGAFYRSHGQLPGATMRLAIRTDRNPQAIVSSLRGVLHRMDPSVPLSGPRTMDEVMGNSTLSEKAQTRCLTIFSLLALILAAVGIYGLLAYSVTQRQREIGIRLALGAGHRTIAWAILRQAGLLTLVGTCAGGLGALGVSHLMRASLYSVGPEDPFVFVASAVVLVVIGALAAWLPARRATRVNPVEALRAE